MGFEVAALGLGELLFGAGAAEAGAVGLGAAEIGAGAGALGAAEAGAAGAGLAELGTGIGAEFAAGGAEAGLGAGLGATELGAGVGGALELGSAFGEGGAALGPSTAGLEGISGVDSVLGEASALGKPGIGGFDTAALGGGAEAAGEGGGGFDAVRGLGDLSTGNNALGEGKPFGDFGTGNVGPGAPGVGNSLVTGNAGVVPKAEQSVFGKAGDVLSSPALKYGLPLAGLGATLLRGEQGLPPQAKAAANIAGAEGAMATSFLQLGQQGQITPAQAAQIAIYKQNAINQLRQQFTNAGRNPSSDTSYIQGVQQIEQQAVAMQQQYIDSLIKNGLAAAGGATAALNQVAQMQIQEDRNFQAAIGDAMKAVGMVYGSKGTTIQLGR